MKFPNFLMNKSFSVRAAMLLAGLFLFGTAAFAQSTTLTIEQCANGPISAPIHCNVATANDGYGRGNLVASKSHYFEGDSVPIRVVSENLPLGTYTITIGYDFTKSGKYATDYLTSYNRTESTMNDPCVGVSGCDSGSFTTFDIPVDPQVTAGFNGVDDAPAGPTGGDDILQAPGVFTCYGCTISSVSPYSLTGSVTGDSSKFITLTFTNTSTTAVIAYGSHISTRADWGLANSAINITGSPYHNFISAISVNFPANNGNRDLQLSADAVVFPATLTIVKLVDNSDGTYSNNFQSFDFTSTNFNAAVNGSFSLMDTNASQTAGGSTANNNIIAFGSTNTITVTETAPAVATGYSLLSAPSCTITSGSGATTGTATGDLANRRATVVMQEGNIAVCTFTNTRVGVTAAPVSVTGQVRASDGSPMAGISLRLTDITSGEIKTGTTDSNGFYTFDNLTSQDFFQLTVTSKRYRFQNSTRSFSLNDNVTGIDFISTSF